MALTARARVRGPTQVMAKGVPCPMTVETMDNLMAEAAKVQQRPALYVVAKTRVDQTSGDWMEGGGYTGDVMIKFKGAPPVKVPDALRYKGKLADGKVLSFMATRKTGLLNFVGRAQCNQCGRHAETKEEIEHDLDCVKRELERREMNMARGEREQANRASMAKDDDVRKFCQATEDEWRRVHKEKSEPVPQIGLSRCTIYKSEVVGKMPLINMRMHACSRRNCGRSPCWFINKKGKGPKGKGPMPAGGGTSTGGGTSEGGGASAGAP